MIHTDANQSLDVLRTGLEHVFEIAAAKLRVTARTDMLDGKTPVFTVDGKYVAQGWTEWTQGFQFGSALLCFDATDDPELLALGRKGTREAMRSHLTSFGVHDHGFNVVSTYGNLLRLMLEGRIAADEMERQYLEQAVCVSGAVQAYRWTETSDEEGFIYSFNGPHSLFSDTVRSLRALALAHHLGHVMLDENDERIDLLERLVEHASVTARYNVYYGEDRDIYDVRGRVAHESIFNVNDGAYRCPSTQQGYSPFSTWTRGLAWIMLGYAEQLGFLATRSDDELDPIGGRDAIESMMLEAATATCDFYIESTPTDGVPYWDTGAPGLVHLDDYQNVPSDPFNDHEPVDSSAAAIAAQALLRMSSFLEASSPDQSRKYQQAALRVLGSLLKTPYLSEDPDHQGLLLHSVYHRPRGWDRANEQGVPCGESTMWGDYHLLEAALLAKRILDGGPYYQFWAV